MSKNKRSKKAAQTFGEFQADKKVFTGKELITFLTKHECDIRDYELKGKPLTAMHVYYFGDHKTAGYWIEEYDGTFNAETEDGFQVGSLAICEGFLYDCCIFNN